METNPTISPPVIPMIVHTLRDTAGQPQKRFTGAKLAFVSTGEHRSLPRWLTLTLFLKADGTYILHRIGYSVMYHAPGGCEGGEQMSLHDFLEEVEDGEACPKCRPLPFAKIKELFEANPDTSESVLLEHNYYKVIELPDVQNLISELEFVPKNSRTGERVISRPGQELLLRASDKDPRIAEVFNAVKDI